MWVCPKCGRSFKNVDQSHYCGKPPATIEEYIAAQPEEAQDYLRQINAAIKASIPETKEKISWSMPTYWKGRTHHIPGTGNKQSISVTSFMGKNRRTGQ